jgi:PAS domain-containing protein
MAQPVELILARNLISGLSLAALLCDADGTIVFFNDAAGELLGQRFDETGSLSQDQWTSTFGVAECRQAGSDDNAPPSRAVRDGLPVHSRICLRARNEHREVELSTVPLCTVEGFKGAIMLLWQPARPPARTER